MALSGLQGASYIAQHHRISLFDASGFKWPRIDSICIRKRLQAPAYCSCNSFWLFLVQDDVGAGYLESAPPIEADGVRITSVIKVLGQLTARVFPPVLYEPNLWQGHPILRELLLTCGSSSVVSESHLHCTNGVYCCQARPLGL